VELGGSRGGGGLADVQWQRRPDSWEMEWPSRVSSRNPLGPGAQPTPVAHVHLLPCDTDNVQKTDTGRVGQQ
jgi:hypothetical protein